MPSSGNGKFDHLHIKGEPQTPANMSSYMLSYIPKTQCQNPISNITQKKFLPVHKTRTYFGK